MDASSALSFIKKPEHYSPKNVYDRLYLDFSKRSNESKLNNSMSLVNLSSPRVRPDAKIEDLLMIKQTASKNKLKNLKAKYRAEEMKEVKQAPEINPISRMLVEGAANKTREVKSAYIKSILSASRFAKINRENLKNPKTAKIRLEDLEKPLISYTFQPSSYSSVQQKNFYIQKLKSPEKSPEHESFLEMNVINRGKYWMDLKSSRIEKLKNEFYNKDLEGCTFSPELLPRIDTSRDVSRPKSVNTSYSQLFQSKKRGASSSKWHPKASQIKENHTETIEQAPKSFAGYTSLSPHPRKLGFRSGMDIKSFMVKARPMIRYNSSKYIKY